MTPIVAVDIDDTLTSFNNLAREVFVDVALERGDKRLQRGAYCAWGEWRSPADVTDDAIWSDVIDRCHSDENILRQRPFEGVVDTLWELDAAGYDLRYISNRNPNAWQATHHWLNHWGFPEHSLVCTRDDKLSQIRDCQYLLDDRPKTLVEFVYDFRWKNKHGSENSAMMRKGFGLYMPYNAALTDVPGIKLAPNWKLLRRYMIEQGVLTERTPIGYTH